jgi:hypothetical protein
MRMLEEPEKLRESYCNVCVGSFNSKFVRKPAKNEVETIVLAWV